MQNGLTSPGALLVIDSDARVRSAITALLRVAHPALPVVEATNSTEALNLLRTASFDVIIVDAIQRSPETGISLIAHLRVVTDSIIIASATRSYHRSAAREAGAHDFISKSTSADILLPVITRAYEIARSPKPATQTR